mgnify:CR=1 FL=1
MKKATKSVAKKAAKEDLVVHATNETFRKEVLAAKGPVLVDFSASWCGPCQRLGKVLPAIAETFKGRVKVVKVDVDESPDLGARFAKEGVPTMLLVQRGKPLAVDCGFASRASTEAWLTQALEVTRQRRSKKPRHPTGCCG